MEPDLSCNFLTPIVLLNEGKSEENASTFGSQNTKLVCLVMGFIFEPGDGGKALGWGGGGWEFATFVI